MEGDPITQILLTNDYQSHGYFVWALYGFFIFFVFSYIYSIGKHYFLYRINNFEKSNLEEDTVFNKKVLQIISYKPSNFVYGLAFGQWTLQVLTPLFFLYLSNLLIEQVYVRVLVNSVFILFFVLSCNLIPRIIFGKYLMDRNHFLVKFCAKFVFFGNFWSQLPFFLYVQKERILREQLSKYNGVDVNHNQEQSIDLIDGINRFNRLKIRQVMQVSDHIIGVRKENKLSELLKISLEKRHTRLPVFEEDDQQITGILHVKDLMPHIEKGDDFDWHSLIRNPLFVDEMKKLNELLNLFQEKKVHIAIVKDLNQRTIGLITLEDVLEEIVGEINDEFDSTIVDYQQLDENTYLFDASTRLDDMVNIISPNEDEFDKPAQTISGLIIKLNGGLPKINERFVFNQYELKVESLNTKRIQKVRIKKVENHVFSKK